MQGEAEKIALDHLVEPLWPVVREQVVPFYHSEEAWRHITSAILTSPALLTELQAAELRGFNRGMEEAAGIAEVRAEECDRLVLRHQARGEGVAKMAQTAQADRYRNVAQAIRQRMETSK